jgi:hypothetical protein
METNYSIHEQSTQGIGIEVHHNGKQAYALVYSLKYFKPYVGYSRIIAYVPHAAVKDILTQQDCLGIHGKWVSKIQEYDMEIMPTKLVKVQRF